jgi:hypothetical protein
MQPRSRTFLVECYLPGVDPAEVTAVGARASEAAAAQRGQGRRIEYLGAILVSGDEVVFHRFSAPDPGLVAATCETAGLSFERVVESVDIEVSERVKG